MTAGAALWCAWLAVGARGAGFEVTQQSAIAGGTAHAGTGRVDATSAWFDPAALADDGGVRLALGAALAAVTVDATSAGTGAASATGSAWQSTSVTPLGTPPHLYASAAYGPLLVGVAVNTAFAGGVRWPDDGPLRFEAIESTPRFVRIAPFVGGRLGVVRVAAGVHVDTGALHVRKATDHVEEEGQVEILLRGTGVGADASLYVPVGDVVGIGASYKGRTVLPLHGEADFDVPAAFSPGLPDQTASARWRLPDRFAVGASGTFDRWRVVADVVWTTWSVNDELHIVLDDPATDDVVQRNGWRNTLAVRGGGELALIDVVTARAGIGVDGLGGAAVPTDTLGPSSPDGTRVDATLGAGVALGGHARVDAYGEWLTVLARTSTSADAPEASYRGRALIGGLTASASF